MMTNITVVGLDLAKSVFQVHGVDSIGRIVVRRKLRRGQVLAFFAELDRCLIGLEACGTSHHWARLREQQKSGVQTASGEARGVAPELDAV